MEEGLQSTSSVSVTDLNRVANKSGSSFFKWKKKDNSKIILVLALLTASLFVAVIILSVLHARSDSMNNMICDNEGCLRIAAGLKESMDTTVDPCDDFYKYTCGRWSVEHPIPDSYDSYSWYTEKENRDARKIRDLLRKNSTKDTPWAVMQAKALYESCMDAESNNELGRRPLEKFLTELNLPLIPSFFTKKRGRFVKQLGRVKRIYGLDVFFGLDVFPDPKNNTRNIVVLGRPSSEDPLQGEKQSEEMELDVMIYAIKKVIGRGTSDSSTISYAKIKKGVDVIQAIINDIESLDENVEDEDDIEEYMYVDDLQKIIDDHVSEEHPKRKAEQIFRPFIEEVLREVTDLDLENKDKILIEDLDYVKSVSVILAGYDDKSLELAVWWAVVESVLPYCSITGEFESSDSASIECANTVNRFMDMAVSWLIVSPSFHDNDGPKVFELLENIRSAFATLVAEAEWLDEKNKMAALDKNEKIAAAIGHPKWLFKKGKIDEHYKGIHLREDAYLDNLLQLVKSENRYDQLHIINAEKKPIWDANPTDVNLFYAPQHNQITVSAGFVCFPFFGLGLEALNYGIMGSSLGHELTHGFDNYGRRYDSAGNLRQWWTNETIAKYKEKAQCFVEHYNTYYEAEVDDHVDGELTLNENIADSGGLREAVLAYRGWVAKNGQEPLLPGFTHLTHEQLLFLGFAYDQCGTYTASALKTALADEHAPYHVRILAVLKNSQEFSDAWKCPVGSNMNPREKCRIW